MDSFLFVWILLKNPFTRGLKTFMELGFLFSVMLIRKYDIMKHVMVTSWSWSLGILQTNYGFDDFNDNDITVELIE